MFPFKERLIKENYYLRAFNEEVLEEELVWHRDKEDRLVTLLEGQSWKIQFENQLPIEMKKGAVYHIKKEQWHRVIKGEGSLKIIVEKRLTQRH